MWNDIKNVSHPNLTETQERQWSSNRHLQAPLVAIHRDHEEEE
jgi:hypothetical protein